jgi:hypothetical protein
MARHRGRQSRRSVVADGVACNAARDMQQVIAMSA